MTEDIDVEKAKEDFEYFCKEVLGLPVDIALAMMIRSPGKPTRIGVTAPRGRSYGQSFLEDAIEDLDVKENIDNILEKHCEENPYE